MNEEINTDDLDHLATEAMIERSETIGEILGSVPFAIALISMFMFFTCVRRP